MAPTKAVKKKDARSLMRKHLGKETADAMLNKLDKMAKRGAPASAIEKMTEEELSKHMKKVRGKITPLIFFFAPPKK